MEKKPIALDAVDLQLLQALQQDASQSNHALAQALGLSPPTCLRRVRRLQESGLIERQVALLQPERLAAALGHGLQAIVEVSLDRQDSASLDAFEARAVAHEAVQQCWRVSSGPDFILVLAAIDMPSFLQIGQGLFTSDANVRNVKNFFSIKRAKFSTAMPLPGPAAPPHQA
ncbi:MAG: Lrp/AsnC family transcriptional regulator [Burkholderiaceae bacterium]|jgi:DNA-binding Lrp family transcriptional regulator|nr:Lrp/AsnC family transcriptional regulator [Burkholderiaceae bacterium]